MNMNFGKGFGRSTEFCAPDMRIGIQQTILLQGECNDVIRRPNYSKSPSAV